MAVVGDASSESLIPFIYDNVERGSNLVTDGWSGYSGITENGYTQTVHNQSKAQSEDEMLPHVHLVLSLLKRWLLGTPTKGQSVPNICNHTLMNLFFDSTGKNQQNEDFFFIGYSKRPLRQYQLRLITC
jgi:hypothetical protein